MYRAVLWDCDMHKSIGVSLKIYISGIFLTKNAGETV